MFHVSLFNFLMGEIPPGQHHVLEIVFSSACAFRELCVRHESYRDSIGLRIWRSGRSDEQAFGTDGKSPVC